MTVPPVRNHTRQNPVNFSVAVSLIKEVLPGPAHAWDEILRPSSNSEMNPAPKTP